MISLSIYKIKYYRKEENLKQSELAKEIQIPLQTLKSYESGLRSPSIEVQQKICRVFGISLFELEGEDILLRKEQQINFSLSRYNISKQEYLLFLQMFNDFYNANYKHFEFYSNNVEEFKQYLIDSILNFYHLEFKNIEKKKIENLVIAIVQALLYLKEGNILLRPQQQIDLFINSFTKYLFLLERVKYYKNF